MSINLVSMCAMCTVNIRIEVLNIISIVKLNGMFPTYLSEVLHTQVFHTSTKDFQHNLERHWDWSDCAGS